MQFQLLNIVCMLAALHYISAAVDGTFGSRYEIFLDLQVCAFPPRRYKGV